MSSPPAHWLPRADSGNSRGDLLRRSFEDRLETRDDGAAAAAPDPLERLRLAELERQAALAAIGDLPDEVRGVIAGVLALPAGAQAALGELL
jgi:hypothetical protein